ncbi:testis-expressed sequence 11 isoform X2 [Podarcis lilfordi]|uniref:Protein ZIP4 homolog n=1 Tax=Podarcis lilfordi TaxID=74358 RepID=A0AA35LCY6_9SAUR|nr:testis-expressed sequence 11 isoform X2 [Podarcis lilfordi]
MEFDMEPFFSVDELDIIDPVMEIKEQIEELMKKEIVVDVDTLLGKTETVTKGSITNIQKVKVEETALSLWNWTTARNTNCVMADVQKVQLLHVACKLMKSSEGDEPSEQKLRREILMATKTGKGYANVGKSDLANEFFEIALDSLKQLYVLLKKRSPREIDIGEHKSDIESGIFKIISFQAESAVAEGDHQKAVTCVLQCKNILMSLPQKTCYLSRLCYNFGVEEYTQKRYEESSFWLCQSYEIGKMDRKYSNGKAMQAKVLRLLSNVYLDSGIRGHEHKALVAVTMANEEDLHPAGLFLKIRILLKGDVLEAELGAAIDELLRHGFTLDFFVDIAKLLLEHERQTTALDFLDSLAERFKGFPDFGKISLLQIELLIQTTNESLAQNIIEGVIADHNQGKFLRPETLDHLHHVLWDRATKYYKEGKYYEALEWYTYSFKLCSGRQIESNIASLERNMAACFLRLKEPLKAKEALKEAERHHPNCIFTYFYFYKIAILENDVAAASHAIDEMERAVTDPDSTTWMSEQSLANLLKLAAQFALENRQHCAAIKALECLSLHLDDCGLIAADFKCLVPLIMYKINGKTGEEITSDLENLLKYLTAAYYRYDEEFGKDMTTFETRVNEVQWFRKTAWTFAAMSGGCLRLTKDLFLISFKFARLCPAEKTVLLDQRLCLLMAIAIGLEMGRNSSTGQNELLVEALRHIEICWDIGRYLKETGNFSEDSSDTLLLLYEFEARVKLGDPKVISLLDTILERPNIDTKMLESIASLAMAPPAYYPSLAKKALRKLLTISKCEPFDGLTFSKCIHSLIQLTLPSDLPGADPYALVESQGYFEEALKILDSMVLRSSYPDEEIFWLMVRAWNIGVYYNTLARYVTAEQWCRVAMFFLNHLRDICTSYRRKMTAFYQVLMDRLPGAKGPSPNK